MYTISEHRHSFAVWAAGRAANTKGCRFPVKLAKFLIEETDLRDYASDCQGELESADKFDFRHRGWRKIIIDRANVPRLGEKEIVFTHGVAAKLINIYLKATIVCLIQPLESNAATRADIVHPPIDRLLLLELDRSLRNANDSRRGENRPWKALADLGWSKFTSDDYERAITGIRSLMNGRPLWMIEEHWVGHQ